MLSITSFCDGWGFKYLMEVKKMNEEEKSIKNICEWITVKIIVIFILVPLSMVGLFLLKIFYKKRLVT